MGDERIAGTRVPDTAIHRASLWLEEIKYPGRRENAELEGMDEEALRRFLEGVGLAFRCSPDELTEAAKFYGTNLAVMLVGDVRIVVMTALGPVGVPTMMTSAWVDGFMHGAATVAGKRGLSNDEIRSN